MTSDARPKIYTRTGDAGETALFDGTRVSKADRRVAAYGDVDELGAWIGFVCAKLSRAGAPAGAASGSAEPGATDVTEILEQIQRDLFALGAQLADPRHRIAARVTKIVVDDAAVARLEGWIDRFEAELPPLRHFILSGGSEPGACLHLSRAACRRAERAVVSLGPGESDPIVLVYLNRLSDLLFVMARAVNARAGVPEIEW